MMYTTALFYFFAAILVFAGLRVITARNPVHAALYLVLAFFTAAGLWMLLEAEFLAIVLVLVYVGAVMVLFLFVVMMLDINLDKLREGFWKYLPVAGFISVLLVIEMALILGGRHFGLEVMGTPSPQPADYSNTRELGRLLYTDYVYAFELAAVILLVAIVAAIALTLRRRKDSKFIDPAEQVKVKRNDRLRIVKMAAEKGPEARIQDSGEKGA
ncbi:NADH-quinone oxidoreductase subunit J [Pseudomonas sp.]|uniref:NADH-quinone oxidoreductase subunit J n=1 Tax=Pseudomonas sp. TaxID=306 RepID=UPI0023524CC7|nr:NADH-quinone oxidoreductase subunit J [Pseudomonas sp.]